MLSSTPLGTRPAPRGPALLLRTGKVPLGTSRVIVRAAAAAPEVPKADVEEPYKTQIIKITPETLKEGGLTLGDQPVEGLQQLGQILHTDFLQVNLGLPALQLVNIEPPIFVAENFLDDQQCEALVSGEGEADLLAAAAELLPIDAIAGADVTQLGVPEEGGLAFESVTVAPRVPGGGSEAPAYSSQAARDGGVQRRAALHVPLSGAAATHFPVLDISVATPKGSALVFFPGFKNGRPDSRASYAPREEDGACAELLVSGGLTAAQKAGESVFTSSVQDVESTTAGGAGKAAMSPKMQAQIARRARNAEKKAELGKKSRRGAAAAKKKGKGFGK